MKEFIENMERRNKMKEAEIMIGDWMDWSKSPFANPHFYSQVVELEKDGISPCVGIPITHEILEKNGITLLEVGDNGASTPKSQRNRYEKWFIHTKFVDTYLWYDRLSMRWHLHNMSGAKFKHVHELQHALRLCGLNDLADNFKI